MDLLQSQVVHKVGRKWKPRWAVLRKVSQTSDGLTLLFYKNANQAKEKRRVKHAVYLTDFCESFKLAKIEKVQNILAIIMVSQTEFVSYENLESRDEWERILQDNYGKEAEFRVTVPIRQKIKPGDACLGIYRTFFSLSSNSTCKAIGRWALKDLYRYAVIEGSFYFEVKKQGKRKTYLYSLASDECDSIVQEFDEITENEENEDTEMVSVDFHGSGVLDDLQRARRRDTTDHNIFQRTMLRMSNRMRRNRHKRAETFSTSDRRNSRTQSKSQAHSMEEERKAAGSTNDLIRCKERRPKLSLGGDDRNEKLVARLAAQRSSSFAHFGANHAKSKSASELQERKKAFKSSGSTSKFNSTLAVKSESFRGASTSSDVFEDDPHDGKDNSLEHRLPREEKIKSDSKSTNYSKSESVLSKATSEPMHGKDRTAGRSTSTDGPPIAPPRSPISLGMFSFPSPDQSIDSNESELKRTYVNRDDLALSKDGDEPPTSESVTLRRRSSVSLLEEIDKEYKRRTNTSLMDGSSSVASVSSSRNSADIEVEYGKQLKHGETEGSSSPTRHSPRVKGHSFNDSDTKVLGQKTGKNGKDKIENGRVDYKNERSASAIVNGAGPNAPSASERLARRESATKHLSDPLLMNRLLIAKEHGAGSLSDLEQPAQYINVQDTDDEQNIAGSYVNVSATGSLNPSLVPKRGKAKIKPPPLKPIKTPWEKYDDEDPTIYHRVGPLVSSNGSRSSEHINAYQNVSGYGSYENIAGRGVGRDRGYVNVPSPSSKKPTQPLNYVIFGGARDNFESTVSPRRHSPLAKSIDLSYKVDYTMIDEKATSLINKTREEHQQRREEDAHSKMVKKGR